LVYQKYSEDLEDQETSLKLFNRLKTHPDSQSSIDYADRHWKVIQRFGRFPHRNRLLGRTNTPEETEFLNQPGSGF